MTVHIPRDIAEVTAPWLTEVLRLRYPDVTVATLEHRTLIVGTATKLRVAVTYNEAGTAAQLPPSMIIKSGFRAGGQRHSYQAELYAYRDILGLLETNAPKCFVAELDPVTHDSVLVLEDLAERGVCFCDSLVPLNYDQAAAFLDMQARFHARWLGSPALNDGGQYGWVRRWLSGPLVEQIRATLQPEPWRQCLSLPRGGVLPRSLRDPARLLSGLEKLSELHAKAQQCFVHADAHLLNCFIEPDGKPGFIDWQGARAPWYQDFTYFLIGALDWDDRRRWERPLLQHYLQRLATYGAQPPQFDEAWLAYRRDILYGFWIFCICPVESFSEEVIVACNARFTTAMIDHDSLNLFD